MIASRRGVALAAGVAGVLAIILAIDLARTPVPASRTLVPGFAAERVTGLAWVRAGEPPIELARPTGAARWRWTAPVAAPADGDAVEAVLAALRGGRWHRRAAAHAAGISRVTLTVRAGTQATKIDVGAPLPGAGQTWLVIGDAAVLVDDWVARALAPEPLALRVTRPLAEAPAAATIVAERATPPLALRLEGQPRRLVRPVPLVVAPALATELHRALAALTIVGLPEPVAARSATTTLALSISPEAAGRVTDASEPATPITVEVRTAGCKEPLVAIAGTQGEGCISPDDLTAIEHALAALDRAPADIVDRRALPIQPVQLTLPDGGVLDLSGKPRIGDRDADATAVTELVIALATPVDTAVPVSAAVVPSGTIVASDRGGTTVTLELLPGKRVRRRGEPVALVPGAGAWDILVRPSAALRDPILWTEEPLTIRSITIDGTTYTRGAVIGEWTRRGPGTDSPNALAELVAVLALPRAIDAPRPARIRHRLSFELAPPGGAPTTRTLEIGARRPAGCEAIVDGRPVLLATMVCDAIAVLRR